MKIKDLYNKIANDELEDTRFKYDGDYFKYWKKDKKIDRYEDSTYDTVEYYNDSLFDLDNFNDEVEIIEEEKEIEPLAKLGNYKVVNTGDDFLDKVLTNINERINHLIDKQTEIIDVVNELRREK